MKINFKEKYEGAYAVLFGGSGYERDISLLSAGNFIKTAAQQGFNMMPVYIDRSGAFYIYFGDINGIGEGFSAKGETLLPTFPIKIADKSGFYTEEGIIGVRLCVPVLHGDYGEDGRIQGLLESAGISFVGCDTLSGAVSADKAYTKALAASIGVPILSSFVYSSENGVANECLCKAEELFGYPAFIKPCRLGSSFGASLVRKREEFIPALEKAAMLSKRILIEKALTDKRELECAYFSLGGRVVITPPGEAVCGFEFYDYDAKYKSKATKVFSRADVDSGIREKLFEYTKRLADAISVRHIARFDYFLSADGELYFNEVNTFPGMTGGSLYSAMLAASGIDFPSFVRELLLKGDCR